ncbi:MAG TPA: hypothetical protein VM680_18210 [Verrucomicrobiae bacterium]|nr:hypothetical protein [Verrucomicrobiae bacterium]
MKCEEDTIGAHGGGIPPGWDFPEAHRAAELGVDLWLLDSNLRMTPWQRIEHGFSVAAMAELLRSGLQSPKK